MPQPDFSPAADRNKQPILERLMPLLAPQGRALEIASGTGQHVTWFAQQLPEWTWQPTELHAGARYNIAVRVAETELDNVLEPLALDVRTLPWCADSTEPAANRFDLILCFNMLHVAPWEACTALFQGSQQHLTPIGALVTYGPYFEADVPAAASNLAFDASLREHDPSWGIRSLSEVQAAAAHAGMVLHQRHTMPANNLLLVWTAA